MLKQQCVCFVLLWVLCVVFFLLLSLITYVLFFWKMSSLSILLLIVVIVDNDFHILVSKKKPIHDCFNSTKWIPKCIGNVMIDSVIRNNNNSSRISTLYTRKVVWKETIYLYTSHQYVLGVVQHQTHS